MVYISVINSYVLEEVPDEGLCWK